MRSAPGVRGYLPEIAIATAVVPLRRHVLDRPGRARSHDADGLQPHAVRGRRRGARTVRAPALVGRAAPARRPTRCATFLLGGRLARRHRRVRLPDPERRARSTRRRRTPRSSPGSSPSSRRSSRRSSTGGSPGRGIVLAVAISIVGLFLLTGAELSMSYGDAITLVTARAVRLLVRPHRDARQPLRHLRAHDGPARGGRARLDPVRRSSTASGTIDGGVILTVIFTGVGLLGGRVQPLGLGPADDRRRPGRASSTCSSRWSPGSSGTRSASGSASWGTSGPSLILAGIFVAERGTHAGVGAGARAGYLTARSREAKNAPMPEVTNR